MLLSIRKALWYLANGFGIWQWALVFVTVLLLLNFKIQANLSYLTLSKW